MIDVTNCVLLSKISADQTLRLTLESQPIGKLANGEVLVRVEAAPINPSDIGGMLSSANLASARLIGTGSNRALVADMQAVPSAMLARRIGIPIQIGNEGAGTVIAAADDCAALIGKRVAMLGGAVLT